MKKIINRMRNIIVYILEKNKRKNKGENNHIYRTNDSYIRNTQISILGNDNTVIFGENCDIRGLKILIMGNGNIIEFGKDVAVNASTIKPTVINAVGGKSVKIGDGCLLSYNIEIHTTDYHGIYNLRGERINPDKNIQIGKYVWIGLGVKILKGTEIADGCVIGAGSVLSGLYQKENVILVGNPARIIKEQIFWKHQRQEHFDVPGILRKKWNLDES